MKSSGVLLGALGHVRKFRLRGVRPCAAGLLLVIGLGVGIPAPLHATPPTLSVDWRVSSDRTTCSGPTDASGQLWTNPLFDDSTWSTLTPPDTRDTTRGNVSRFYRGRFTLDAPVPVWLFFATDDGVEVFINGSSLGSFGRGCSNDGCINRLDCGINYCIAPIAVAPSQLVAGANVVSAHVWNGPFGEAHFELAVLPADPGNCTPCTLNGCVSNVPTPTPTITPTPLPTNTPIPPACAGKPVGSSCDDGLFCTGTETCDGNGNCLHSGDPCATGPQCHRACNEIKGECDYDGVSTPCDDGDPCTLYDQCDGKGTCSGTVYTGDYTILAPTSQAVLGKTQFESDITGSVCAYDLKLQPWCWMQGDVVALRSTPGGAPVPPAIWFRHGNIIGQDCATAGGWIKGPQNVIAGGPCDSTGTSPVVAECVAAQCRAAQRLSEWANLPVTPGFNLGAVSVKYNQSLRIPALGTLGPGTTVIDLPSIQLGTYATLRFAGDANTGTVIVRVHGPMRMRRATTMSLSDDSRALMPQQIIWIVDGPATIGSWATVAGTIVGNSKVSIGFGSILDGAVIANQGVTTNSWVVIQHKGFIDW